MVSDNKKRRKICFSLSLTGDEGQYSIYYINKRDTFFWTRYLIMVYFIAIQSNFHLINMQRKTSNIIETV